MRLERTDLRLGRPRRGQSPVEHRGFEAGLSNFEGGNRPENVILKL